MIFHPHRWEPQALKKLHLQQVLEETIPLISWQREYLQSYEGDGSKTEALTLSLVRFSLWLPLGFG